MINFDEFDVEEKIKCVLTDSDFCRFLQDRGAYNRFINNLQSEIKRNSSRYYGKYWFSIETFCEDLKKVHIGYSYMSRYNYTGLCFHWAETPEGRSYWNDIDMEWFEHLKSI